MAAAEWAVREELAACYHLAHHHGLDDVVWNHITARVPGEKARFLTHQFGQHYTEVTASGLLKVRPPPERTLGLAAGWAGRAPWLPAALALWG